MPLHKVGAFLFKIGQVKYWSGLRSFVDHRCIALLHFYFSGSFSLLNGTNYPVL